MPSDQLQTTPFAVRGISMSTYSQAGYSDSSIKTMVERAVSGGANQVILSNIVLADLKTGSISDVIEAGRNQTADLASVERAVRIAQTAGMQVVLKPQVAVHDAEFDQYNSASWINMVNPNLKLEKPEAFFANYKAELLDWAVMAQRNGVAALSIGNEMVAATKPEYTHFWLDIIASVREVYSGQLTYAALAPVMTNSTVNEITQVGFWDKLDYAGFDVYPSLTHNRDPSVAELVAGWSDATVYGHRQDYVAFIAEMARHVGKPIVFMETGLPSFDGASDREATSDGYIGSGQRATDHGEQADWWQAFFQTWNVDAPKWLKGVFVVNNDPGMLGSYYDQNYNIDGKPAEKVIAAWFGGSTSLSGSDRAVSGGQADDRLFLYDPSVRGTSSGLEGHQKTVVEVVVTAAIADGTAPVLRASINGTVIETMVLRPHESGYVASDGTHWTTNATYVFELDGLVRIDQLRIDFASPVIVNGKRSSTFFHSVSVNGVALLDSSYYPEGATGAIAGKLPIGGAGGTSSQWGGGYTLFDAAPWNAVVSKVTLGTASDPIVVDGGAGEDVLHLLGSASAYSLMKLANGSIRLVEASNLRQNAVLTGVETLTFADGSRISITGLKSLVELRADTLLPITPTPAPTPTPTPELPIVAPTPVPPVVVVPTPAPPVVVIPTPVPTVVVPNPVPTPIPPVVVPTPAPVPASPVLTSPVLTSPLLTPPLEAPPMTMWSEDGALLVRGSFVARADLEVGVIAADKISLSEPLDIIGNGFAQRITGTHGANVLNGGGGGDTLVGLEGDDTYLVNDPRDRIVEANGGGVDTVYTVTSYNLGEDEVEVLSTVSHVDTTPINLIGNFASQRVIGNYGANVLNGGSGGIDTLIGLLGDDTYAVGESRTVVIEREGQGFDVLVTSVDFVLSPEAEIEVLAAQDRSSAIGIRLGGNGYAQTIAGTEGADTISGGGGADLLIGGGGADRFDLEIAPMSSGSPSIADFSSGVDKIGILFGTSDLGSRLDAAEFIVGAAATTAAHRIVYDQVTGGLFYDADGSGVGASVMIGRLTAGTTLSLGDFEMVAPTATTA